ncbi:hypothetical protein C2D64_10640 [Listeria ivanovii]|nr:hypothetical protein C2D64_10640 [Listeria ivanovii]PZG47704.1 hypothetical protein C2D66_06620 [Listeria ivanovii]PZH10410.1 hypothetical protein C2D65_10590 [Listeria ivanovii]
MQVGVTSLTRESQNITTINTNGGYKLYENPSKDTLPRAGDKGNTWHVLGALLLVAITLIVIKRHKTNMDFGTKK